MTDKQNKTNPPNSPFVSCVLHLGTSRRRAAAFTLMELLVVVLLIGLVAAAVFPTLAKLRGGSDTMQAYNIFGGQVTTARAQAVGEDQYHIVHMQLANGYEDTNFNYLRDGGEADSFPDRTETSYASILKARINKSRKSSSNNDLSGTQQNFPNRFADAMQSGYPGGDTYGEREYWENWSSSAADISSLRFGTTAGFVPKRIPGTLAMGELSSPFVTGTGDYQNMDGTLEDEDSNFLDFITFSVLFSPQGQLVKHMKPNWDVSAWSGQVMPVVGRADRNVRFGLAGTWSYNNERLFYQYDDSNTGPIWDSDRTGRVGGAGGNGRPKSEGEPGAEGVTMFDLNKLKDIDSAARIEALGETGQFIPINHYSGQVFKRR